MKRLLLFAWMLLSLCNAMAFEVAFTNSLSTVNGVPDGWMLTGSGSVTMLNQQPQTIGGESGLCFSFRTATGTNLLRRTIADIRNDDISCDNVFVSARVYVQKEYSRSDSFQIVISTNNWATEAGTIKIGDPIMLEESGRTIDEWKTIVRSQKVLGLKQSGNDVSVGIVAGAAGRTSRYGYLQSLRLSFAAMATPKDICFEVAEQDVTSLMPGETNVCVTASIDLYPADAVTIHRVYCVLRRNNCEIYEFPMTNCSSSAYWQSEPLAPAVEAGELLDVSVCAEYITDLDALGEKTDGVAKEQSEWHSASGAKLGSVWINEFSLDQVELCGTTNRIILSEETGTGLSNWMLELSKADVVTNEVDLSIYTNDIIYRAFLPGTFDFTANMINGVVGLETRDLFWKNTNMAHLSPSLMSSSNLFLSLVVSFFY